MRDAPSGDAVSDTMEVNDETHAPDARWLSQGDDWVLELSGAWRGHSAPLPELPATEVVGAVRAHADGLRSWDASLASALWHQIEPFARRGADVDLQALPDGLQQILALALDTPPPAATGCAKVAIAVVAVGLVAVLFALALAFLFA